MPRMSFTSVTGRMRPMWERSESREQSETDWAVSRSNITFKNLRMGKLSESGRARAAATKNSLVAFAERYGTPEQAERIRSLNPAYLDKMERAGIIDAEALYNYEGLVKGGFAVEDSAAERLDRVLSAYDTIKARS